ncbi:PaaI family thioesterase [Saccharopolyspora hirsuta]|uniref:PaaI family thioesterase n=1 Tax=Saccharopolyspora hirsuta TaxID=1837 RepID=UPI003328D356
MTAAPDLTSAPREDGVDAAVAAARRVIESLLRAGGSSTAEMDRIADQLNSVADHLDEHAPERDQRMVDMWAREDFTRHDPVTGPENAIAPPLHLTARADGSVRGVLTLGLPYQGPPGHVHGGISALLLDHALGVANHRAGLPGMTAELTLRYHRPTPLFEPLTVTARQVAADGRKIRTTGAIEARGEVCVSAEGLFIAKHLPRPR